MRSLTQKHTHLQAAQISPTDQSLQKSVLFSSPSKLKNKKFPSLLKNKTSQSHTPRQSDTNIHGRHLTAQYLMTLHSDTDDRRAATNSGLAEMAGSVVKETFVHLINFVPGDSEVLRTPPLRKPANRYASP